MTEINTAHADTILTPYFVMEQKIGEAGMRMLEGQLELLAKLNEGQLYSPLREALKTGDTTLPEGTLVHSTGMHASFDIEAVQGIAAQGIVSGELIGISEDSETHGCADFFRVTHDTSVEDYLTFANERLTIGNIHTKRGEQLIRRGVTFIVDPQAEGVQELLAHDGYRDPAMADFINPPVGRTAEDTAAILGGVPRGAIAGILASEKLLGREGVMDTLTTLFPEVPVINHQGVLHTQVRGDVEGVGVGGW